MQTAIKTNGSLIADIKASIVAEMHKVYRLRTHVVVLAVTLSLIVAALLIEFLASRYAAEHTPPGKSAPINLSAIWQIFHFFCQYITPIVIALIVAFQSGKEFEWKTYHQIQLKGQTPAAYVVSKLVTFAALASATYLIHFLLVVLVYGIRTAVAGESFDLPLLQIITDFTYSLLAISIALFLTVLVVSASVGIVLTLVYLCVLEMILLPLIATLSGAFHQEGVATALSYSPMKLPERLMNSALAENISGALIIALVIILLPVVTGWLSYFVLNRRQIGLIR
ncbi:MAG: ABC transporter permease [Leptospiraceae bacterium]|nr:ABC transporter permease [Leptospiraceae bacterium]